MPVFIFVLLINQANAIHWPGPDNSTSYKDCQIWSLNVTKKNLSKGFEEKIAKKDVLHRCDNNIDFLLNGNETEYWNKFLESRNISYAILLDDVQRAIEREGLMKKYWRRDGKINWTTFPRLNDIYVYLKSVAASNPGHCSLRSIGKTSHKKDIQMIKLSNGNPSNKAFLIEGGMHAREWITVSALLYFIEHIAWNFTGQPAHITSKDWYIIPVINPDGYEYSMNKDRLWRKNRRRFSGECDGVDLNRNFDVNWSQRGASNIMCSEKYCGPEPFSELETIALKNLASGQHFTAYVGVHAFGSMIFYPWVHSGQATFQTSVHIQVSKKIAQAMESVDKEHFRSGTVTQLGVRRASGTAVDWMFLNGVPHAYIIETRGNKHQLFMEANQIYPSVREVTAGLTAMAGMIV